MLRRHLCKPVLRSALTVRWATITPIGMPALSPTMEQGKITEWAKKVGDAITAGDTWCRLETDKATVAFDNASEEGYIARILRDAGGDPVPVGDTICLLVDEEADINCDEVKNWKSEAAAAPAAEAADVATPTPAAATTTAPRQSGGRVVASPLARSLAKELGVDVALVKGTGGSVGRVTKDDVVAAAKAGVVAAPAPVPTAATPSKPVVVKPAPVAAPSAPAAPIAASADSYSDEPVSGMRAVIASRLTQSKNVDVPHYYETNECKADNMLSTIKHLNSKANGKYKISVNDYIIKAIARANMIVPACNSHWHGDYIRKYNNVDVSVAVATPAGLITPIIKNAHAKGLAEISIEAKALAKKAREGGLQPSEYQGGTVTISNLGGMGTHHFTAIINPPQSMILACGTTVPKPEIIKNEETGEFTMTGKVVQTVTFTASFDHRVVDGAVGAEWFKHFKDAIENPLSLLL